jgi:hypothetical protein
VDQFIVIDLYHPVIRFGQIITGYTAQAEYKKKPGYAWNKFFNPDLFER